MSEYRHDLGGPPGDSSRASGDTVAEPGRARLFVAVLQWSGRRYDADAVGSGPDAVAAVRRLERGLTATWPGPDVVRAAREARPRRWDAGGRRTVRGAADTDVDLTSPIASAPRPSGLVHWHTRVFSATLRVDAPKWLSTAERALRDWPRQLDELSREHADLGGLDQAAWTVRIRRRTFQAMVRPALETLA